MRLGTASFQSSKRVLFIALQKRIGLARSEFHEVILFAVQIELCMRLRYVQCF